MGEQSPSPGVVTTTGWGQALSDARGGKVVFLSHCLLNQNTRYPGGAVEPGVVEAALAPCLEDGVGVVQLPCPEQQVWGGVLKRRFLWLLAHPGVARTGPVLVPAVRAWLRWRYRRLARRVAREVADYDRSGFETVAVVGVADSPSCGVQTTVDLRAAVRAIAAGRGRPVTVRRLNDEVVDGAVVPGRGLWIEVLTAELHRRGLTVPVTEHRLEAREDLGDAGTVQP